MGKWLVFLGNHDGYPSVNLTEIIKDEGFREFYRTFENYKDAREFQQYLNGRMGDIIEEIDKFRTLAFKKLFYGDEWSINEYRHTILTKILKEINDEILKEI